MLDLRSVLDFKQVKSKEGFVLGIDMVNGSEQLRFKQEADLEHWKKLLQEWKEYHERADAVGLFSSGPPPAALHPPSPKKTSAQTDFTPSEEREDRGTERRRGAAAFFPSVIGKGKSLFGLKAHYSKGRAKRDRDELDSLQLDDGDADEEIGNRPLMKVSLTLSLSFPLLPLLSSKGIVGSSSASSFGISNWLKPLKPAGDKGQPPKAAAQEIVRKPKLLEGWLEKKGTGGKIHVGGDWQKRYLRIDEANATLTYSKSSDSSEKPSGSIDFKLVVEIVPHTSKSGQVDFSRFDIDIGDKVLLFFLIYFLIGYHMDGRIYM